MVPEQSAIHSVADLKGKRVGLNKGSDVNYLLVAALEKAGLSYKDITPVYLRRRTPAPLSSAGRLMRG